MDEQGLGKKMIHLLENPYDAKKVGEPALEHVLATFLLPELMRKYLILLRFYTETDQKLPDFRINELTYSEQLHNLRRSHPELSGADQKAA